MTQIPISEIPEEGLPLSYSEEAAELDLAVPGARFLQPIAVDLVLVKAAGEISAHGRIKTSVMCECVRCLSQFPVPLDILVATQFRDRKSTRLNSSHLVISYAVFCLKKKKKQHAAPQPTNAVSH